MLLNQIVKIPTPASNQPLCLALTRISRWRHSRCRQSEGEEGLVPVDGHEGGRRGRRRRGRHRQVQVHVRLRVWQEEKQFRMNFSDLHN